MSAIARVYRNAGVVNCLRIGMDKNVFTPGIVCHDHGFYDAVHLQEGLVGPVTQVHLRTEEVGDAPVCAEGLMLQARATNGPRQDVYYTLGARRRFKGVLLAVDAMRMRLPAGLKLLGTQCIPGGVNLTAPAGKRFGFEKSGRPFSFEKQQLFMLQPGEQIMVTDSVREAWGITHTVLTIKMCKKWLVAKYPTKDELEAFLSEQQKLVTLWKNAQPIGAMAY